MARDFMEMMAHVYPDMIRVVLPDGEVVWRKAANTLPLSFSEWQARTARLIEESQKRGE